MKPKRSSGGSRPSAGEKGGGGGGGGGVRGGPFGFHFGLKVRGFRPPGPPLRDPPLHSIVKARKP